MKINESYLGEIVLKKKLKFKNIEALLFCICYFYVLIISIHLLKYF